MTLLSFGASSELATTVIRPWQIPLARTTSICSKCILGLSRLRLLLRAGL